MIRLLFQNPVTKSSDYVLIPKKELEVIQKNENKDNGIIPLSFFFSDEEQSYLLSLHIDKDYKVRSVFMNRFFLYVDKKLFSAPSKISDRSTSESKNT